MLMTTSAFTRLWSYGYTRLVPIIPPDAEISERSSLFKRVGTAQDSRGKAVGVRGRDGRWFGFDWLPYEAEEADLPRWHAMGAGVGIKTGGELIAIDADTKNADFARIIRDTIEEHLGRAPVRVGQYPKALYPFRISEPVQYHRIDFGPNIAEDGRPPNYERVEILSEGRQFVAEGIHPKTKQPYAWPRDLVPFHELPTITPEKLEAMMAALQAALPEASKIVKEGSDTVVDQAALKGSPEHVRKAVEAIPNSSASFPSREHYRDLGYAIKAALPDDEAQAFEIFADWCARWQDGENDPGIVEADWRRMKPPFRRGAGWIYEMAETIAPEKFSRAEVWFEPIPEDTSPFAQNSFQTVLDARTDTYPLLTIGELIDRPPPVYMVERHIPQTGVGFLYSDPGVGKSFWALDVSMSIAHGFTQWNGDALNADPDSVVIYIASEGSFDLRNRLRAWLQARNIETVSSRFLVIERTIDFLKAEDVEKLLRTVAGANVRPAFVVVDTVSRAMPGADENLQKDMTLFVQACDRVKDAYGCAVLGVHHAGKSGDMRGSTVLRGGGDFVFKLERNRGATIGTLTCEKQKGAPDGWDEPYRFDLVQLGDGQSSLVVSRADVGIGPDAALTPDSSARVLDAMRCAWDSGAPWSKAPQTKERFYVRRMVADFGFRAAEAEKLVQMWEASGFIGTETLSKKSRIIGFKVLVAPDKLSTNEGVFG